MSVDIILLDGDAVLLIQRGQPPFAGAWALPGGFVEYGERVEDAARREAKEETGLDVELDGLVGVYSAPERDPRHHTVTIAFRARLPEGVGRDEAHGASDAAAARWFPLARLPELAFDHATILRDAQNGRI